MKFQINTKTLKAVASSMSKEASRFSLNGAAIDFSQSDCIRLVATDGHRLTKVEIAHFDGSHSPDTSPLIIPKETVKSILQAGDGVLEFEFEGRLASYKAIKGAAFDFQPVEANYPDYNRVIPLQNEVKLNINRASLESAVKSIVSKIKTFNIGKTRQSMIDSLYGGGYPIQIDFEAQTIGFYSASDLLEPIIEKLECDKAVFQIGYSSKYLLDLMQIIKADSLVFELKDTISPARIKYDNITHVLMPLRV